MYTINNFTNNDDVKITKSKGQFSVIEYVRDLSVLPQNAQSSFFAAKMNIRRKQVICDLNNGDVVLQKGAMQWMLGNVESVTGIKGAGDFFNKAMKGKVSGESTIKPEYRGSGIVVLEPTYKHIILLSADDWNNGIVLDDGLFLACDASLKQDIVMRKNLSSAVMGGEGLLNLCLSGSGIVCLESQVPEEELIEITLQNDVIKIDGNLAIAWSKTLDFTVERSGKTLLGSGVSGEGFVNVYRGTGKILMAPVTV